MSNDNTSKRPGAKDVEFFFEDCTAAGSGRVGQKVAAFFEDHTGGPMIRMDNGGESPCGDPDEAALFATMRAALRAAEPAAQVTMRADRTAEQPAQRAAPASPAGAPDAAPGAAGRQRDAEADLIGDHLDAAWCRMDEMLAVAACLSALSMTDEGANHYAQFGGTQIANPQGSFVEALARTMGLVARDGMRLQEAAQKQLWLSRQRMTSAGGGAA